MVQKSPELALASPATGTWVQVDRKAMEQWGKLAVSSPLAAGLLMTMTSKMGRHNALIASQKTLAELMGCTDRSIRTALSTLKAGQWIDIRQIGQTGSVNAYIINKRVAWSGKRDGMRYALFSAAVLLSEAEQPDKESLDDQLGLFQFPTQLPGEQQLPTGPGLEPPSEPMMPGLEPDIPALKG